LFDAWSKSEVGDHIVQDKNARFFVKVHHGNETPWQVLPHEGCREREIARGLHRPSLFEAQLCYSLKHRFFGGSAKVISDNLFSEVVKRNGKMNWALVAPLFWAPMLPLTRIAAMKVPPNLRLKIYLTNT
jgi:hypothetical protein